MTYRTPFPPLRFFPPTGSGRFGRRLRSVAEAMTDPVSSRRRAVAGIAAGACLALAAAPAPAQVQAPTQAQVPVPAQEMTLLEKMDTVRAPADDFTFTAAITGPDGNRLKLSVRVNGRVKSLVRYLEPPRSAGRSLLFIEQNMWVYVPGTRKVLRISPQQRVLGGVASADVARMVYSLDYDLESVEELPRENGERRRRLILSRRSKGGAYARVAMVAGGEEARPLRAGFFASTGSRSRRLKTAWFEGYREVLGRRRPTILRVIDHVRGDRETILEYSGFTLEATPDAWFQPAYLKRLR